MLHLADTNLLLRLAEPKHPMHAEARGAINALVAKGDTVCTIPQNIIEFWNVATRPAVNNGLGFTTAQTQAEVEKIEKLFQVIPDVAEIFAEWKRLVIAHAVIGKQVHDTRLVAAMNVHQITHLLTFNKDDFKRFQGITVLSPQEVMAPPPQSPTPNPAN